MVLIQFLFLHFSNRPIFYGLQASIRKLKTGQIRLLILSADLKPRYVANQIIVQALAGNEAIRILCVPNLNDILRTIVHFSCYAFVINSWADFSQLDEWTLTVINDNYPVPQVIRSHFAQRQETCSMEVDEYQAKHTKIIAHQCTREHVNIKHLHLYRINCESIQRVFVPKNGINLKPIALEIESLNKIKSDYISLDAVDGGSISTGFQRKSTKMSKRPSALYRDLTIYKIQNNPKKGKKLKTNR